MIRHILPKIPAHKVYVEPFAGGLAVFWAKEKSEVEVINDLNSEVYNFWLQCQNNFEELNRFIQSTIYSRELHDKSMVIYHYAHLLTPLERAWAFWMQTNMSFMNMIYGSWAYGRDNKCPLKIANKQANFKEAFKERLKTVYIEHKDVLKVIETWETPDTFFYLDPPYMNADQGHYKGYTPEDYTLLLYFLSKAKGKFLLSCYDDEIMRQFAQKYNWTVETVDMPLSAGVHRGRSKRKTECLVCNY